MKKTAVVYHYLAHYRLPIFQELMKSNEISYTLISAKDSGTDIKTINPNLSNMDQKKGGLRWIFVKNKWLFSNKFLWQRGLLSILREKQFDSVIFLGNPYYISTWVAMIYLKFKRKNIYLWTHGVTDNGKNLKWYIRKIFYNLGDGILLYGNNAKDVMTKNGFPQHKLHVIYNSLDYEKQLKYRNLIDVNTISETKNKLFQYSELPVIVFVGRLTRHKKLDMIIEAAKVLHKQNFKINTLFIGAGEAKTDLENMVGNYNLSEYVNFHGACYDEQELSRLIGSADICVSPGEVGLTAMTSLGYGTPVISHSNFNYQMPEYEAILPGINGDLFNKDSIESLVEKIKSWLEINKDVDRKTIQENCFSIIDTKYNPKNQVSIINSIILEK